MDNLRKKFILGSGLAICLYAVVVVAYAAQSPDIGISCSFDTTIQRVDGEFVPAYLSAKGLPQENDLLWSIGTRRITTWSEYLRALAQLPSHEAFPRLSPPLPPDASRTEWDHRSQNGHLVVSQNGNEYVRVEFVRQGERHSCWCLIGTPPASVFVPSLAWFVVKMGLFFIGAIVFWQRPQDRAALRFFILCIFNVGAFMGGYHWLRIATCPPLIVVFMVCAVMLPVVSLHFYLVFPRPKPFLENKRWPMALLYGVPGLLLAFMLVALIGLVAANRMGYGPEVVTAWSQMLLRGIYVALGLSSLLFLGCIISLLHSYRVSPRQSLERQQVKWICLGALLAAIPISYTLYLAVTDTEEIGLGGATWPMFLASLCFTLAYAISISRYGMMEVRQALTWGIVTLGVSMGAGLVYSVVVLAGTLLTGSYSHLSSPLWQAIWVSLSAWIILLVSDAARWRLREMMHRRIHKTQAQLDETLRRINLTMEQQVDLPALCKRFLETLTELVDLEQGAIYLRSGEPSVYRLVAHRGKEPPLRELPPGSPLIDVLTTAPLVQRQRGNYSAAERHLAQFHSEVALPLRHEGTLLAVLLMGPTREGRFDLDALPILTSFAQITALALHNTQGHATLESLNRELQDKVLKISEQQRRIVALQSQVLRLSSSDKEAEKDQTARGEPVPTPSNAGGLVVGSSPLMRQLLTTVRKVAASPSAVLIRGESGTGKELLAQALHDMGARAKGPFVKVHCAALSPGLLESELFGHVKGSFTGAHRDKVGRFEMAHGGTLFLDEIGDINLETQTKLLRVLQEMTFERVGSGTPITVDVRLVAATNQDLEKLIREGRFREDLFYRLNVITLRTPPLRERREDIVELALHFLKVYTQRNANRPGLNFDDDALELLKAYDWPGNVRELENVIERAVVLAEGNLITPLDLPPELRDAVAHASASFAVAPNFAPTVALARPLHLAEADWTAHQEEVERQRLVQALAATGGNKARAARNLGMPRSTFISKLEKYGLVPKRGNFDPVV
jgi:transcriptional regulator with GAF, ATPase, and Fis domain/cbb3-type cytochrome oxidase subunit 3